MYLIKNYFRICGLHSSLHSKRIMILIFIPLNNNHSGNIFSLQKFEHEFQKTNNKIELIQRVEQRECNSVVPISIDRVNLLRFLKRHPFISWMRCGSFYLLFFQRTCSHSWIKIIWIANGNYFSSLANYTDQCSGAGCREYYRLKNAS